MAPPPVSLMIYCLIAHIGRVRPAYWDGLGTDKNRLASRPSQLCNQSLHLNCGSRERAAAEWQP
eukprot:6201088-Pleurochrysis_carterae.AAC.1